MDRNFPSIVNVPAVAAAPGRLWIRTCGLTREAGTRHRKRQRPEADPGETSGGVFCCQWYSSIGASERVTDSLGLGMLNGGIEYRLNTAKTDHAESCPPIRQESQSEGKAQFCYGG